VHRFPDVLAAQTRRFTHANWVPKKVMLDVAFSNADADADADGGVGVCDGSVVVDLDALRARGQQADEASHTNLSGGGGGGSGGAAAAAVAPVVNEVFVAQLMSMGFDRAKCERAVGNASALVMFIRALFCVAP
jgi:hypothetical protein